MNVFFFNRDYKWSSYNNTLILIEHLCFLFRQKCISVNLPPQLCRLINFDVTSVLWPNQWTEITSFLAHGRANQRPVTGGTADREKDLARLRPVWRRTRIEKEETSREEKTPKIHLEGRFTACDFPERYISLQYSSRTDKNAENNCS